VWNTAALWNTVWNTVWNTAVWNTAALKRERREIDEIRDREAEDGWAQRDACAEDFEDAGAAPLLHLRREAISMHSEVRSCNRRRQCCPTVLYHATDAPDDGGNQRAITLISAVPCDERTVSRTASSVSRTASSVSPKAQLPMLASPHHSLPLQRHPPRARPAPPPSPQQAEICSEICPPRARPAPSPSPQQAEICSEICPPRARPAPPPSPQWANGDPSPHSMQARATLHAPRWAPSDDAVRVFERLRSARWRAVVSTCMQGRPSACNQRTFDPCGGGRRVRLVECNRNRPTARHKVCD